MYSFTKNQAEDYPIGFDCSGVLDPDELIVDATASAFRRQDGLTTTTLAPYVAGALTVSLAANVKAGAALRFNVEGDTEETAYVQSVSGVGPFVAELFRPLVHDHAEGSVVAYHPGATAIVLKTASCILSDARRAVQVWVQGGASGQKYEVSAFVTLNNGSTIREEVLMRVENPS